MNGSKDMTGLKFGRWTVLAATSERRNKQIVWLCRCDCGGEGRVVGYSLRCGDSQSCGCYAKERTSAAHFIHGEGDHQTAEFRIWSGILARCSNPHVKAYSHYGGRGIRVCERWRESYLAFLHDMGRRPSPGHSINRKDNDGNYEPDNCEWATRDQQALNRRNVHLINGKPLVVIASETGISRRVLYKRIFVHGWAIERALSKPLMVRNMA